MAESTHALERATSHYCGEFTSFDLPWNSNWWKQNNYKIRKTNQTCMFCDGMATPLLDIATIHRDVMMILGVAKIA
jgi:hypothetical protein